MGKRLGDFDHLLLGDRQPADRRARIEIEVHAGEDPGRIGVQRALIEQQACGLARFPADEDILRRRQVAH